MAPFFARPAVCGTAVRMVVNGGSSFASPKKGPIGVDMVEKTSSGMM